VHLLVLIDVLNNLDWTQQASSRELVKAFLPGIEDKLSFWNWKLLSRFACNLFEFLLIERFVEVDQRLEIIEISLVLDVVNLILVMFHMNSITTCTSNFRDFGEEVITVFLLNLKLTKLNIHIEDFPDVILLKFWSESVHLILANVWNIIVLASEEFESLRYL
jgi:hypothetical protein